MLDQSIVCESRCEESIISLHRLVQVFRKFGPCRQFSGKDIIGAQLKGQYVPNTNQSDDIVNFFCNDVMLTSSRLKLLV